MNAKIDLKSALLGLCLGVLGLLATGAAPLQHNWGRFEVAGSGAFFVILDTSTGQAWYGDFHATINNPVPPDFAGPTAQTVFFQPKLAP
jgi:hypothetical protein